MNKAELQILKEEVIRLADWAFTLDLHDIGARLCDCAEQLRQRIVMEEEE